MKYSDCLRSIVAQFTAPSIDGHKVVPFIIGAPGGGKSALARDVASHIADIHSIPAERIIEFNPSLREPSDVLGLPDLHGECSRWVPAEEFYAIRKGVGPSILIIEELSDASMDMMNALCRVILDRHAGQMPLSEELYIIATGNRTSDKSGANRLSTKLANRLRIINYQENLEDWVEWASTHGVSPYLTAFVRFRPNLLSDFDPSRSCNPTPRAWEDVSRIPLEWAVSKDMSTCFYEHVAGAVGEGAAAEFVGFLRIVEKLPDIDDILKRPDKADVPDEPSVLYALGAKLVTLVDGKKVFESIMPFVTRMPPEFGMMVVVESAKRCKAVESSKAYVQFAVKNIRILTGV